MMYLYSLTVVLLVALTHASRIAHTYINYTTVTGYFLQDEPSTNATTFNFTATNFGLINRTYPSDSNIYSDRLTQWQRFRRQVSQLNRRAPRGVKYKLIYMGRHGNGYHNAAETYYGTPAWNCYWSIRDGNGTVRWDDARITPLGVNQALAVKQFWKTEIELQKIPTPQTFYTSPLTRCLQTVNLTFNGLSLPRRYPFVPVVKEFLREGISGHTCDRRGTKTYIREAFPNYRIQRGFSETDQLFRDLLQETPLDQDIRTKKLLDDVFSSDDSTYLSFTSHGGEIASLLRGEIFSNKGVINPRLADRGTVVGHRVFSLSTGATIPVLVKAQTIKGTAPTTASEPYAPICTCTSPPARTATTSDCSYPTATAT